METASLRIKFTPLLKRINNGDSDSKCYIEIVPELSGCQNLEKLNWKFIDNLIEYNIPMTYKILIKKQGILKNEIENKIYYSCVDLLQKYSISNTNFASGDITRILSDNYFLSFNEDYKCDDGTKALVQSKSYYGQAANKKTASVQTVNICEPYSSLTSYRIHVDKSLEININKNKSPQFSNDTVVPDFEDYVVPNDIKNETYVNDKAQEKDKDEASVNSGNYPQYDLSKWDHLQRKLTLSPICSINTQDTLPTKTICKKSNASSYVFRSQSHSTAKTLEFKSNAPVTKDIYTNIIQNKLFKTSSQILRSYGTYANVEANCKNIKESSKLLDNICSLKDNLTTPITNLSTIDRNIKLENNTKIKHTNVNIYDLRKNKYVLEKVDDEVEHSYKENRKENENIICKINNDMKLGDRILPEVRIANFVQNLEKEILPLALKLNEIKYRCSMLGIFCGDFLPIRKSVIYSSISNRCNEIKEIRTKSRKSNRVVYTVLFNG